MNGMWWRRIWHLLNRPRHERELVREMSEHRESMHDPTKFGDTHRLLERSRDAWGWNWLDDAVQDLTVGVRTLVKSPSFAITATLILTFGIGLNVTLFQMTIAFGAALAVFAGAGPVAALWPAYQVLRRNPVDALRHQ
jgi:hypothetical protein